jgi:WD40 repeat protein
MDSPALAFFKSYDSPVIYIKVLHDKRLVFVTRQRQIIFYHPKTAEQKILQLDSHAYFQNNRISVSNDGAFIAYVHNDKKTLHIIQTQTGTIIHSFTAYKQEIDIISFDPSAHYLIIGTAKGRILEYSLISKSFIDRLTSFPEHRASELIGFKTNYVSALAFIDNVLLCSGYGGSVVLSNLHTHTNMIRFHNGRSRVNALAFIDTHSFLEGNDQSTLKKVSVTQHRLIRQISLSIGNIKQIIPLNALPFAVVTSHFNTIALVNYETMELVKKEFITTQQTITYIACTSDYDLYIAHEENSILHVNLLPLDALERYIENSFFEHAYQLCNNNILLQHTQSYKKLQSLFSHHYATALKLLIQKKEEAAQKELAPFKKVKKEECETLFSHFRHYEKMGELFTQKKYAVIYGLTTQYPLLKATPLFKKLQNLWYEQFYEAYALLQTNNESAAKKSIYDFFSVAQKRPLISMLFTQPDRIEKFYTAAHQHDKEHLEQLLQKYPQLHDLSPVPTPTHHYDNEIKAFHLALEDHDFQRAQRSLEAIKDRPHLQRHFSELEQKLTSVKKFFYFYEKHKYYNCYQLMDSRPELSFLKECATLNKAWSLIILRCEKASITGDVKRIKKEFGSLLELKSRSNKIGAILRLAYRNQILFKIKKRESRAYHNGIINYLNFFGNDDELEYLMSEIKQRSFTLPLFKQKPIRKERISWLKNSFKLPNNITDGIIT